MVSLYIEISYPLFNSALALHSLLCSNRILRKLIKRGDLFKDAHLHVMYNPDVTEWGIEAFAPIYGCGFQTNKLSLPPIRSL